MGLQVKTVAEMAMAGEKPDVLFWVGCAGSFDERYKKVTRSFVKILNHLNINFAVLGTEESCTGDPARRAGNEFTFQMLAQQNIQVLNGYEIGKIVTACPHCFNILKNEYPELGGHYEVTHHTEYLQGLINSGRLQVKGGAFKGERITFHDSCYLGRGNDIYEAPRELIQALDAELVEMKHHGKQGMCCGAGGAQVFKEPEKGDKDIHVARIEEAIDTQAKTVAVGCPFCMIMLSDGIKFKNKEQDLKLFDLAELIAEDL